MMWRRVTGKYGIYLIVVLVAAIIFAVTKVKWTSDEIVVKVKDGDSIVLSDGREVRYIGIDCPEFGDPFFEEAKEFNRNLVFNKKVRIELDIEEQDKYKRTLAYVYVDGKFINEELVKNGLAYAASVTPNTKYIHVFTSAQDYARKNRLGLWKDMKQDEEHYIATPNGTRFHRANCKTMKEKKNLVYFKTKGDAFDSGKTPCRECNP